MEWRERALVLINVLLVLAFVGGLFKLVVLLSMFAIGAYD